MLVNTYSFYVHIIAESIKKLRISLPLCQTKHASAFLQDMLK